MRKETVILLIFMSFIAGQISYKMIHGLSCVMENESEEVILLKTQAHEKDSLLYLWFNDYSFHVRVLAGVEKDSSVVKYQKWNIANKIKKNKPCF